MKKFQVILCAMAFACSTFAQTNENPQIPLTNLNNTNFPKDVTEKLSPFMKKVKDVAFKSFFVSEIKENSIEFNYSGFKCSLSETNNIFKTIFHCQLSGNMQWNKLLSLVNELNLASEAEELDLKNIALPMSEYGNVFLCKMRVINPSKAMSEDDIKKHIKILTSWMDRTRSILSLGELGLEDYIEEILYTQKFEKLPLKFLRINCEFPMYSIQYEASPSGIHFLEYRLPMRANNFVNDSPDDKEVFNRMLEDIKENHNGKNVKVSEATYNGVKFKKISYEEVIEGIKRDCCIYYTNLNNEKFFFTTSTSYPRSLEDQKIIDEMLEKRTASKMPVLESMQAGKEQDKKSQEK